MSKSGLMLSHRYEDEVSDTLSTSTPNSRMMHSPSNHYRGDDDGLAPKSKKIRKKRSAYQKIDDDVRVKLLEAVQQNGETLKSAAKRYGINYSSAKSILHTYRKEGRILKKSAQDRNMKKRPDSLSSNGMAMSPLPHLHHTQSMPAQGRANFRHNLRVNTSRYDAQSDSMKSPNELSSPLSPMNKLNDNFVNLLQINQNLFDQNDPQQQRLLKAMNQVNYYQHSNKYSGRNDSKPDYQLNQFEMSPTILPTSTQAPPQSQQVTDTPGDMLKTMDNFYMNYSNSPLSSERIIKDGSCKSTGNNHRLAKEFDSFSDMISALQQKRSSEEVKEEIHIPKPLRFNTAQKLQEHIEAKINSEDDMDWKGTIENAALDTFRTVVDAQLLLCDALKKASFLNNLVQLQKNKEQTGTPQEM
jgi:transposase-like protein